MNELWDTLTQVFSRHMIPNISSPRDYVSLALTCKATLKATRLICGLMKHKFAKEDVYGNYTLPNGEPFGWVMTITRICRNNTYIEAFNPPLGKDYDGLLEYLLIDLSGLWCSHEWEIVIVGTFGTTFKIFHPSKDEVDMIRKYCKSQGKTLSPIDESEVSKKNFHMAMPTKLEYFDENDSSRNFGHIARSLDGFKNTPMITINEGYIAKDNKGNIYFKKFLLEHEHSMIYRYDHTGGLSSELILVGDRLEKFTEYYSNGSVRQTSSVDQYGNHLDLKGYNGSGNLFHTHEYKKDGTLICTDVAAKSEYIFKIDGSLVRSCLTHFGYSQHNNYTALSRCNGHFRILIMEYHDAEKTIVKKRFEDISSVSDYKCRFVEYYKNGNIKREVLYTNTITYNHERRWYQTGKLCMIREKGTILFSFENPKKVFGLEELAKGVKRKASER